MGRSALSYARDVPYLQQIRFAFGLLSYLLTGHSYRRQVSELPNEQIERLREMLHEALEQRISPTEIYDAITRGFDQAAGESASPLAPVGKRFD